MPEIGATLREARMRARIDVSEIEAQTKIRAKYLRALENEEWDLLPGPTFVKSFLRTYAQALGLDGKALVEEYRLSHERPSESELQPIVSTPRGLGRPRAPRVGSSRSYTIAIGAVSLVIVLLVVALVAGNSSPNGHPSGAHERSPALKGPVSDTHQHSSGAPSDRVALSIRPAAAVYVCLLGEDGRKLIPGLILQPGAPEPTYHARSFTVNLGNSSVELIIDGQIRTVPPSSRPTGYLITTAGRHTLAVGQLPTCN